MALTAKPGQRIEQVTYYCDVRKGYFKRNALIDDKLEVRRALCGTILVLRTAWNGHKYLMVKSINGQAPRHVASGSMSLPALLFGLEHRGAHRVDDELWNLTSEAYGIKEVAANA